MLESEAMVLLVSAVPSYKNRDAALALAGSALAVLQDAGRYAAQLGDKGVAQDAHPSARRKGLSALA